MATRAVLLLLLLCLALAGCGENETDGEPAPTPTQAAETPTATPEPEPAEDGQAEVVGVVQSFFRNVGAGSGEQACSQLTPEAQKQIADLLPAGAPVSDCIETANALSKIVDSSDLEEVPVENVQVDGDRATADVSIEGLDASTVELERTPDGGFRITGFG